MIFAATVGGALFVHSYDSFDYSELDPVGLAVASFIVLPGLFGLVLPTVVDTLAGPDGWITTKAPIVLLVIAAIVLSGPLVVVAAPAIGVALLVQGIGPLRRLWASRFTTHRRRRVLFSTGIALGVTRPRRRHLVDPCRGAAYVRSLPRRLGGRRIHKSG